MHYKDHWQFCITTVMKYSGCTRAQAIEELSCGSRTLSIDQMQIYHLDDLRPEFQDVARSLAYKKPPLSRHWMDRP